MERMFVDPRLLSWLAAPSDRLEVARLPRPAWPLVVGGLARACQEAGRSLLVLVDHPERFLGDLRPWLAGSPPSHLFAEVRVSFLDRPPAVDEAVSRRLEALTALAGRTPCLAVSSRRAALHMTISPADLARASVELAPGVEADPVQLAGRLVELGYSRESL